MTSSMMAGERRWASARRGGMTVLGKVPKHVNLPSQRLENHGMDPNVEIVPKGTLSWGSRPPSSTSNAWGTSTSSPNADGGTISPSHLSNCPSSGSGTRPSSSCSDRTHEPTSNAWGQNSRPSSASGALTSNQTALTSLRPRSADTRPGGSQLLRFAETLSDNPVEWGPTGVSEKLNCNFMDNLDSVKVAHEEVRGPFVSEIHQTIKEHFDNLLHSVDRLSARLSQLESKIRQLENTVDNLKISSEYNNGRTDGMLRKLENILREVQDGAHFLRDKKEIAETQIRHAKLQDSKGNRQLEDHKTAVQADSALQTSLHATEQSPQPIPISGALFRPDAPSTVLYQNATPNGAPVAAPVQSQMLQNPIASCPELQSYYLPAGKTLETTYQHYNVSPSQQPQPPPPLPTQLYQPALNLLQVSESIRPPQLHPPLGAVNPQNQPQLTHHHTGETPHMPSHNYQPSILQSSSLPPSGPPIHQYYMDSSQQMHSQPSKRPNSEFPAGYSQTDFSNMDTYSGSSSHYPISTMKPSQLSPSTSIPGGGSKYTQLPKAQILPHALPTASSVGTGSSTGGGGNQVCIDDVVDKVTAMGFRRDFVRATVRKLTENGQSVDLNVVLDKLMNNDGNVQWQQDSFGR